MQAYASATSTKTMDKVIKHKLFHACQIGDVEKLKALLPVDDINTTWNYWSGGSAFRNGDTPLHVATSYGKTGAVEILLEYGADVHKTNDRKQTALHLASKLGIARLVKLLIQHDADVYASDKDGCTPLHVACESDVAEILIGNGADINATNNHGRTPLHTASKEGHSDVVDLLISICGANIQAKDSRGNTPLHIADMEDVVDCLITHGADAQIKNNAGETLAHITSNEDVLQRLLHHGERYHSQNHEGMYPLHVACLRGNLEAVSVLLQRKADVNAKTSSRFINQNKISVASPGGHVKRYQGKVSSHDYVTNYYGQTPLHLACFKGHYDIVKLLLVYRANINATDSGNNTPLHVAAGEGKGFGTLKKDTLRFLLSNKVKTDARNHRGWTPLHLASFRVWPEAVKLLLNAEADANAKDNDEKTPLHLAGGSTYQNKRLVEHLLQKHADLNAKDKDGMTPLHYACHRGDSAFALMLIENGAEVNIVDNRGRTPLHYAAAKGHIDTLQLLIDRGAAVDVTDNEKNSPFSLAASVKCFDVCKVLKQHAAASLASSLALAASTGMDYEAIKDDIRQTSTDFLKKYTEDDVPCEENQKWITRAGGKIDLSNVNLRVVPHALEESKLIHITEKEYSNSQKTAIIQTGFQDILQPGMQLELQPHGQTFKHPVCIELKNEAVDNISSLMVFPKEIGIHGEDPWTDITDNSKLKLKDPRAIVYNKNFSVNKIIPKKTVTAAATYARDLAVKLLNNERTQCDFFVYYKIPCTFLDVYARAKELEGKYITPPPSRQLFGTAQSNFYLIDEDTIHFSTSELNENPAIRKFCLEESKHQWQHFSVPVNGVPESLFISHPLINLFGIGQHLCEIKRQWNSGQAGEEYDDHKNLLFESEYESGNLMHEKENLMHGSEISQLESAQCHSNDESAHSQDESAHSQDKSAHSQLESAHSQDESGHSHDKSAQLQHLQHEHLQHEDYSQHDQKIRIFEQCIRYGAKMRNKYILKHYDSLLVAFNTKPRLLDEMASIDIISSHAKSLVSSMKDELVRGDVLIDIIFKLPQGKYLDFLEVLSASHEDLVNRLTEGLWQHYIKNRLKEEKEPEEEEEEEEERFREEKKQSQRYIWAWQELSNTYRTCTLDRLQTLLSKLNTLPDGIPQDRNILSFMEDVHWFRVWENLWRIRNAKCIPTLMDILRILVADELTAQHAWTSMMKISGDYVITLSVMEILCLCAEIGAKPTDEELQKLLDNTDAMTRNGELTVVFVKTLVKLHRNKHFTCDLQFLENLYEVSKEILQLGRQLVHAVHKTIDSCLKSRKLIDVLLFISNEHEETEIQIEDFSCENWLKRSPLHLAAIILDSKKAWNCLPKNIFENNLNKKDLHGCTPLYLAHLHDNKQAVKFLSDQGAKQDVSDTFRISSKSIERTTKNHPDIKYQELCRSVLETKNGTLKEMRPLLVHSEVAAKALSEEVKTLFERLLQGTRFRNAEILIAGSMREKLKAGCLDEVDIILKFEKILDKRKFFVFLRQRLADISWEGIGLRPTSVHGPWELYRENLTVSLDVVVVFVDKVENRDGYRLQGELLQGDRPLHKKMVYFTMETWNFQGDLSFKATYYAYEWNTTDSLPTSCRLAIVIAKALLQAFDLGRNDSLRVKLPVTSYMITTALFYILAYQFGLLDLNDLDLKKALAHEEGDVYRFTRPSRLIYNPQPKWLTNEDVDQHGEVARVWGRKIFSLIKCLAQVGRKLNSYWDRRMPVVSIEDYGEAECIGDVCECALERLKPNVFY